MKFRFEVSSDDWYDIKPYMKTVDMSLVLYHFANRVRDWYKHGEEDKVDVEKVHKAFWEICNEYGVDPYD